MILWRRNLDGWDRDIVSWDGLGEGENRTRLCMSRGKIGRKTSLSEARFECFQGDCSRRLIRRTLEDADCCKPGYRQKNGHAGLGEKCASSSGVMVSLVD